MNDEISELILKNSLDLFVKRSYEKVFIADIAKLSSISRGSVYWRFKNKKEIFKSISEKMAEHIFSIFDNYEFFSEFSAELQIRIILEKYYNVFEGDSELKKYRELLQFKISDNEGIRYFVDICYKHLINHKDKLEAIVEKGKLNNEIDKSLDTEFLVVSFMNVIMNFERFFLDERRIYSLKENKNLVTDNIIKLMKIKQKKEEII